MTRALVMFSGGFESVAVVHKLLQKGDYDKLLLLYNSSINGGDKKQTKRAFRKLNTKANNPYNVELELKIIDKSNTWVDEDKLYENYNNQEFLLNMHLSFIETQDYAHNYIGWENNSAKENSPIAMQRIKFWEKIKGNNFKVFLLDELFDGKTDQEQKTQVISYILENDLFDYCDTHLKYNTGFWYELHNEKVEKMMIAMLQNKNLNESIMAKIFNAKDQKEVQEIYNKEVKKL